MADYEIIRPRRDTWFDRLKRSITLGPFNPKDPAIARYFGRGSSLAGIHVTEQTAMNYSAVWAAVNLISSHVASVPLHLYKRNGTGKDLYSQHPLYRILHDRPNEYQASVQFRRALQSHALLWGNGYAEIERDRSDRVRALWPLMPWAVEPYWSGNTLRYRVYNPTRPPEEFEARDILHIRGIGGDGTIGQSVIPCARESLGLGIAAEKFGAAFFGNGSTFGGIISYPPGTGTNPQTRKDNRDALEHIHQGVERAHRFLALYEGAKFETVGVPPNAAQFLETREFQIEEVCRWFNMPPHKLKHLKRATNNNIEHQGIEYVTDTLDPWWVVWEQELSLKLISDLERNSQVIEHVREGLLRGDAAARGEFYSKMLNIGAMTPNEIRARENLNPVEGGDTVFVPANLWPLDRLSELMDATIASKTPPEPAPPTEPPPPQDGPEKKALEQALIEARKATQLAEDLRDLAVAERDVERELHGVTRTELAGVRAASDEAVAALTVDLRQAEADRDAALALAAEAECTVTATLERIAAVEARAEQAEQAREAQRIADAAALETAEGLRTAAETERETAIRQRDEVMADAAKTLAALEVANQAAGAYIAERQALAETAQRFEAERDTALTTVQTVTAEADTLRADLARARADIATELDRARSQKATMLAAMRSLFVDASERQLQKEIDRARKHQATPAKLRAWIEGFYPMQEASVRAAFQPIVGPWTALTGGAPNLLLDRLVAEHIEASRAALTQVADVDEADAMAAALERTLYRWEHERADAMADALVREGMGQ